MSWTLTHTGQKFRFDVIDFATINIEDIAHALAHQCRFNGHTNHFYSVAQHCVHVMDLVPGPAKLAALLHDAAEAYLGDMVRPVKHMMPDYIALEKRVQGAIMAKFDVAYAGPGVVELADLAMLAAEKRDLLPAHDETWPVLSGVEPAPATVYPWPPHMAKGIFLARFQKLLPIHLDLIDEAGHPLAANETISKPPHQPRGSYGLM